MPVTNTAIPVMKHADWLAEATKRFGERGRDWRFVCPACGHEASCADFQALGVEPSRAAQECIGRVHNEQGAPGVRGKFGDAQPCNWAAFGLFGTLNGGVRVEFDDGKVVAAFAFAEPPSASRV